MSAFTGTPLQPVDMLGRNKVSADGGTGGAASAFATIERNHFKFKSLSSWSYNIALGCWHGCRFCYVPSSQQTGPGKKKENTGSLSRSLREFGVIDPDAEWGKYVLFRPWDEPKFLSSLRRAEETPIEDLNRDGNRAVILCSTTDPYQTVLIDGNPEKQNLLNHHARFLVRRALELILEHSSLNVRILTRSPLAKADFDLYKKFGDRLIFGMSIPTMQERFLEVYEPNAPGPKARLDTLRKAADEGIPLYVAVAPTYPECDEADLRATIEAIRPLKPLTIFHEPINIRAENVERIAAHAKLRGVPLKTEVFDGGATWRKYAIEQLMTMQKVAHDLGVAERLHLWPDKSLKTKSSFIKARLREFERANPGYRLTAYEKKTPSAAAEEAFQEFENWLSHWHNRVSEWPSSRRNVK